MKKRALLAILVFLFAAASWAQTAKYSNEFLSLGVGARGLALSNTMTALADDITAAYWNPAGLGCSNEKYQLSLMHAAYFADIAKYDYAALAYEIDKKSAVAFTFLRFGVDNILNTTQLVDAQGNFDYDKITTFSSADMAFLLTYAHHFEKIDGLSVGGNAKIIRRKIGKFAGAWGFGLDFGVRYETHGWKMGAVLRDGTSTFNAWSYHLTDEMVRTFEETGNDIPKNGLELTVPQLLIGGGKYVNFGKGFNATFALDFDFSFDGKKNTLIKSKYLNIAPHFGMEFAYKKIVALRAGIGNFQKETDFDGKKRQTCQINLGIGVGIKDIVFIDYAFTDVGDLSIAMYSHIFSLKVALNSFKIKKKEKEKIENTINL